MNANLLTFSLSFGISAKSYILIYFCISDVPSQMPTGAAMHPGAMNQQRIGAQMGGMQMRGVTQGGPRMAPPNMRNT